MNVWYSDQAYQLTQWAREENNRVKASRIMKVSQRLEQRKLNNISSSDRGHWYPPITCHLNLSILAITLAVLN